MKKITDQSFKYIRSDKTDVAATFRRIRKQQAEHKAATEAKVQPIKRAAR